MNLNDGLPAGNSISLPIPFQDSLPPHTPDMNEIIPVTRGLWLTVIRALKQLDERCTALENKSADPISDN
jgi:hypothetical protein